jgi:hypothetical protein
MALTRKMLEAMGIDAEKIDSIIEAHTETVNGLKSERDSWKTKAESIDTTEDWKSKYEKEHSDFEFYKTNQQKKETRTAKESALRAVYSEAGISEKFITSLLRIADYDEIELDKSGKIKNHASLVESAKTEYADFIPQKEVQGAKTAHPPVNSGDSPKIRTKAEIMEIKDTAERQKAWGEYLMNQQKGTN